MKVSLLNLNNQIKGSNEQLSELAESRTELSVENYGRIKPLKQDTLSISKSPKTKKRFSFSKFIKDSVSKVSSVFSLSKLSEMYKHKISVRSALKKLQNMSVEEYNTLSESEIQLLREEYNRIIDKKEGYIKFRSPVSRSSVKVSFPRLEKIHKKTTNYIKDTLDKKYGENRYKVIILGRSLSSFGKCLGYRLGEENVINIPLSSAGYYNDLDYLNELRKNGSLSHLKKYLSSVGLSKEKMEDSGKKYVMIDYCFTGNSLKGAEKLLKHNSVLGQCNMDILDIEDCIPAGFFKDEFSEDLRLQNYKTLSYVGRCDDIKSMQNCDSVQANSNCCPFGESTKLKLLRFKLLYNEMNNR